MQSMHHFWLLTLIILEGLFDDSESTLGNLSAAKHEQIAKGRTFSSECARGVCVRVGTKEDHKITSGLEQRSTHSLTQDEWGCSSPGKARHYLDHAWGMAGLPSPALTRPGLKRSPTG